MDCIACLDELFDGWCDRCKLFAHNIWHGEFFYDIGIFCSHKNDGDYSGMRGSIDFFAKKLDPEDIDEDTQKSV